MLSYDNSSVIRQKGESQNGGYKKRKHAKFFEKTSMTNPLSKGVRNKYSFFEKFGVLFTSFLRFALLPYYLQILSNTVLIMFLITLNRQLHVQS